MSKHLIQKKSDYSTLLLVVGIILLHLSQSMFFVAGDVARLGSLGLGLGSICYAAYYRVKNELLKDSGFILKSGAYFMLLGALTLFQEHAIWQNSVQIIFAVVCILLLWSGYLLGRNKRKGRGVVSSWGLASMTVLTAVCISVFLRYNQINYSATLTRSVGDSDLNPVGVAYVHICIAVIFFVLGASAKALWRKVLFFMVVLLALMIVITTGSRGPVLWGGVTFFYILNLMRVRLRLTVKSLVVISVTIGAVVMVAIFLYKSNPMISERMDVLSIRFSNLFLDFSGESTTIDASSEVRRNKLSAYWSSVESWWLVGEHGHSGYPHQQWLEIFVKFGVLGLPMFLMSVILFLKVSFDGMRKKFPGDIELLLIASLFLYAYLQSMTSLSLYMNRMLWLGFGYFMGYYSSFHNPRRKRKRKDDRSITVSSS
ncbi:hypothetical protein OAE01_02035 [Akkermansiaceae bacterium]|nr:hypothetical protein [Akkermansiaceae bacterium]MDB4625965.1 hypothetical protein [Akkermansiaceae bacterium]